MNLDYDYVLAFATEKHAGQFRKDGKTPYIEHPKLVAKLVKEYKTSRNIDHLVAAALLHDTLEDTYTSYRELTDNFGEIVASLVLELTTADYMVALMGKAQYLERKMVEMSNYALVVKLADRLANVYDCQNLTIEQQTKLKVDTIEILRYIENNRELTGSQKRLIAAIRDGLEEIDVDLPKQVK